MIAATYTVFGLGVLAYAMAAGGVLAPGHSARVSARLLWCGRGAAIGALLLAGTLAMRAVTWKLVPLTTSTDSLNLLVVLGTATALTVARSSERHGLLVFYLPALAAIALFSAALSVPGLTTQPKALSGLFLAGHVFTAFLAYALLYVASLTSAAYAIQVRRLKTRRSGGALQRLPALEQLDATLYLLIRLGYPIFAVTLGMGLLWAWHDRHALTAAWWYSPKIIHAASMAALFAASYHARALGLLRGPKLAYLVFVGFATLLGVYLALEWLSLTNYNFFSDGATG